MSFSSLSSSADATLRSQFIRAYIELQTVREKYARVTVEDPQTARKDPIETKAFIEEIDGRYNQVICNPPVVKMRITDKLANLFRKDDDVLLRHLVADMLEKKNSYEASTFRRSKYGLLSPIAFCRTNELSKYLGPPRNTSVFDLVWCPQFQQLGLEGAENGGLELLGISNQGLLHWWSDGGSDEFERETRTWRDLQNLAFKQVYLLDAFYEAVPQFHDIEAMNRLRNITGALKRLTLNVIRLVYLRHEDLNNILPLFELLVPANYTLSVYIKLNAKTEDNISRQAIYLLERYTSLILDLKETIATQLDATSELQTYEVADNSTLTISEPSRVEDKEQKLSRQVAFSALFKSTLQELKKLGLTEVDIDWSFNTGGSWSGSFGNVCEYKAKHGDFKYAVKFLKPKTVDDKRIKKRLIREATAWKMLSHKNINMLIGYCVDPNRELPGLVSPLCSFTLESYLRQHLGQVAEKEKLEYLVDIADALNHMHSRDKPVTHGDLRPANVLLALSEFQFDDNRPSYKAVISDFGVSSVEDSACGNEWTSKQRTNDYYIAPELLPSSIFPEGKRKRRVTIKGDIYAFGCTFYVVIYDEALFGYANGKVRRVKRSGGFPALRTDVRKEKHWALLKDTWNSDASQRPSSKDVLSRVRSLCMEEHAL